MKKIVVGFFVLMCVSAFIFAQASVEQAAYPSSAMEFVVTANPGGGSDILARSITEIIQSNNLVDVPINIVNKPGGSGAIGQAYFNAKTDYDYNLLAFNSASLFTMHVAGSKPKSGSWTPIAGMAMDNQILVVPANSRFNTWAEVERYMKANPESLTLGCADDLDAMTLAVLENETGVKFNHTAYFAGSAMVVTALLGEHIEFGIVNPVECVGVVEAGRLKVIASFSPERIADAPFDKAPTFVELGYPNCIMQMVRGVIGPAGMSKEAQKYWSDVCEKVASTDAWKKNYLEANLLEDNFLNSTDFEIYYKEHEEFLITTGKELGML